MVIDKMMTDIFRTLLKEELRVKREEIKKQLRVENIQFQC